MINPLDIEKKEFRSAMRGYDKNEVNSFMLEIANTLEKNINNFDELSKKYDDLKEEVAKYKNIEETMSETLLVAKQTADELMESARKKEELMLREAEMKVEEKIRKGEMQVIEIERNIDKLILKYESEKIRLTNFLKAQLALLDDDVPTIESIKENSQKVIAKKQRAEVIKDKNRNYKNKEEIKPKEALIHTENMDTNLDSSDDFFGELPNLESIKQDLKDKE